MSVIPKGKVQRVQFCEGHVAPFAAHAAAIGTSAGTVADLAARTAAARAAYQAQRAAQLAAMSATLDFDSAVAAMTDSIAEIIKQVKARAASAGDSVYSLAQLPVPARPSPIGTLAEPTNFKADLLPNGTLNLSWKCTQPANASGTVYQVSRRVGMSGEFVFLGSSGKKNFIDTTLPAGSAMVTYQIQAVRSTSVGPAVQFIVNFGVEEDSAAARFDAATGRVAA